MDPSVESDQAHAARRVGEVVGRYRLERVLGVGGMGAVYVGRSQDGFVAAIKILHGEMSSRRDVRERFYREGYVANSVQHPGVVRVLEHGDAGADAFLAMELLSGETLSERVKRYQTLPITEVLGVADQVLDVLRAAHEKGIVHRDLKPDNLFVTHSGQIKILDFGLARLVESAPGEHRTRSGVALGTLPYMAPEQALGRRAEIDGRVDIFALGATMFRLLSGRRLHEAPSEAELLIAMATRPAPPLISVAPQVPLDICRVVDLALAFARDARYPSAEAMQTDVRAVGSGQHPPYALARLSHRDQKTRVESAPVESPDSSVRGPQGTLPLVAHQANLGATLGGQAVPNQLAQTFPSAVAPNILAHTVPSAGAASQPRVPVAAPLAPASLSQTHGPGVQLRDAATGNAGSAPIAPAAHAFGPAVQSLSALGQTYPSAQNATDLPPQQAFTKTPVEVIVRRHEASELAQTYPSAVAMPGGLADTHAAPPPGAPASPRLALDHPQAPPQFSPYGTMVNAPGQPQPAPYAAMPPNAPGQPQPVQYGAAAPIAPPSPQPGALVPPATPANRKKPASSQGHPLLWVLAALGLLASAGVALALVTLLRGKSDAPTSRNSSSSLTPPTALSPRVEAVPAQPDPAKPANPIASAPPTVDLAPVPAAPVHPAVVRKPSAAAGSASPPAGKPAPSAASAIAPSPAPAPAPSARAPTGAPPPSGPAARPKLVGGPVPLSDLK